MGERLTDDIATCGCGNNNCSNNKQNMYEEYHHNDGHHGHDHNHQEFTKRDIIEFFLALGLFISGLVLKVDEPIKVGLFVAAYIIAGRNIVIEAVKGIFSGKFLDENFLMTIASITAFIIGEHPEGTAVILFYRVGELFEGMAVNKSKNSIEELLNIKPDIAHVKVGDTFKDVAPEKVNVDDIIMVKPGEKIPIDGEVVEGVSAIDTSVITGESLPREAVAGTEVYSGSINLSGAITVRVTKAFSDSTVAKILKLVKEANQQKANTEKFITKFAKYYTPIVVGIAVLVALIPPLVIGEALSTWVGRAAIFLVVSCPCALVISIPLGYFGGIGGASRYGILVKGGNYLEAMRHMKCVVFDKTGTITKGIFKVTDVYVTSEEVDRNELIKIAAHMEHFSNHPIAVSIVKEYGQTIDENLIKDISEIAGKGLKATYNNALVAVGNKKLMEQEGIRVKPMETSVGTKVYVARDNQLLGVILIADTLKKDSIEAIKALKQYGVEDVIMLTGDHEDVAKEIAGKVGITKYYSELLPHEKVTRLEEVMQKAGKKDTVVFVGDGINDAPVLARADVGIAMGAVGSDAAIEAADVVLMSDELSSIVNAIKISRNTNKIVWQNIIFALGTKVIIMILATFGFANMWMAIFADVGVAIIAILNAIRALKLKG
ncbi:cadmium-translocating P-type ATPase [Vallitalea pronyensis]|uniref:Cd(2+)-exporting ATPase n=1 Tax=Vallitalea pronyensis TaxID=1348613 RepID=A0A8J8MP46_9FIRM|nr:heavy metal translocating P-type ATPase [Vallitalea pronyensis]QUI25141.1 cadmium-translocating P-type ATPase [Vallitalea pronyensis]